MKTTCGLWSGSPKPPTSPNFTHSCSFFASDGSQFLEDPLTFGQTNTEVIGDYMVRKDGPVRSHPVPLEPGGLCHQKHRSVYSTSHFCFSPGL